MTDKGRNDKRILARVIAQELNAEETKKINGGRRGNNGNNGNSNQAGCTRTTWPTGTQGGADEDVGHGWSCPV